MSKKVNTKFSTIFFSYSACQAKLIRDFRNDFKPTDQQGEDIGLKGRMIDLKVAITDCLLALTEGAQKEVFQDIMAQVKPDAFQQTLKFLDTDGMEEEF